MLATPSIAAPPRGNKRAGRHDRGSPTRDEKNPQQGAFLKGAALLEGRAFAKALAKALLSTLSTLPRAETPRRP